MNNFNGYDMFNHIRNPFLRTWNRINTYLNIKERHGSAVAYSYLKKFDRNNQLSIFTMMKKINEIGYEQYRRNFIRARNA